MPRVDPDGLRAALFADNPFLANHIRDVCEQMRAHGREADRTGLVPDAFWAPLDVHQLNVAQLPREYGGSPTVTTLLRRTLIAELLGAADPGMALALPGVGLSRTPILVLGTPAQQAELYARFHRTEPVWGAFATSERGAGSDVAAIATTIRDGGDCWVIDGEKRFIGSGARADYVVVFGNSDASRGRFGLKAVVVERGTPGFTATVMPELLGLRAAQLSVLTFRACRVPKSNMLGYRDGRVPVGDAFSGAQSSWDAMRPILSSVIVGTCASMLDEAASFVAESLRHRPASLQRARAQIDELRGRYLMARMLVLRAAWRHDAGLSVSKEASIAKAYSAQLAMQIAELVSNLAGIEGALGEWRFERRYRDAKAFDILEGTGDMQRLMIAKLHAMPANRRATAQLSLAAARARRQARVAPGAVVAAEQAVGG